MGFNSINVMAGTIGRTRTAHRLGEKVKAGIMQDANVEVGAGARQQRWLRNSLERRENKGKNDISESNEEESWRMLEEIEGFKCGGVKYEG